MKHDPNELKTQGFTIDNTCYPWVAYKGPRLNPDEFFWCYTDKEVRLQKELAVNHDLMLVYEARAGSELRRGMERAGSELRRGMERAAEIAKACGCQTFCCSHNVSDAIRAEATTLPTPAPGFTQSQLREIAVEFFRHWWNKPGSNTEQGFDEWWEGRT